MIFEELPSDREPTRAALHTYSQAAIAISRLHGVAHPKWWHVSFKVRPEGLASDPIPLPDGRLLGVRVDVRTHAVHLETSSGPLAEFSMRDGATGTEMGEQIIAAAAEVGLEGDYDRSKFASDEAHTYDPTQAVAVVSTLTKASIVFEGRRVGLDGPVSPVQLWPHGFDVSFEWFGTRTEEYEEEALPAQLNLGFYPKDRAYFYSNPWPFDESLPSTPLPHGAEWHTEGWQGSILYYDQLVGDPAGPAKLEEFARAVFEAAAPTLTA